MELHQHPGESTIPALAQVLISHTFLRGLKESQLATLAAIAEEVQFHEYDLILTAKEPAQDFYLLVSGSVSVELDKKHFVVRIQTLGPGDAFGCSSLLEHHDSMFDVRARESCTAFRLDSGRLRDVLRGDPVLAAELFRRALRQTTGRLHATEVRLGELCGVRIKTPEEGRTDTIRALNKLIETCLDGELGYRTAAEQIHESKLKMQLDDQAIKRAHFAEELRAEVERLGGIPIRSGTIAASLHRGWITLKSATSGGDPRGIIAACETGEHSAAATMKPLRKWISFRGKPSRSLNHNRAPLSSRANGWLRFIKSLLLECSWCREDVGSEGICISI